MRLAHAGAVLAVVVGLAFTSVAARTASAQALFALPPDGVDYRRYTSLEACLNAAAQVRDSTTRAASEAARALVATFSYEPDAPDPAIVIETARECAARSTPAAPATLLERVIDLRTRLRLALTVGDDAAADSLLRQQRAILGDRPVREREEALVDAFTAYRQNVDRTGRRPLRLAAMERVVAQLDSLPGVSSAVPEMRLIVSGAARMSMDTAALRRAASGLHRALTALPDTARRGGPGQALLRELAAAEAILSLQILRDSGAAAYTTHLVESFAAAAGVSEAAAAAALAQLGTRPPALVGAYWFRRGGPDTPHPAPGKLALVVFNVRHDVGFGRNLAPPIAILQRLTDRLGDALDITVVAQAQGFFRARMLAQPPEIEAAAIQQYLHSDARLPGTLVVEVTPFVTRPDPDRRRFNALTANQSAYGIPRTPLNYYIPPPDWIAFVLDPAGTILYRAVLNRSTERTFDAMLDALAAHMTAVDERTTREAPTGSAPR